jgi:hypothetical protein
MTIDDLLADTSLLEDDWLLLGALSFALAMVVPFYFCKFPLKNSIIRI